MKQKLLIIFMAAFAFYSCGNDSAFKDDTQEIATSSSMLKFKDQAEFDQTLQSLANLNDEELKTWADAKDFNSLYKVYNTAISEVNNLNSASDYNEFKSKYDNALYFPEVNEDLGPYMPVSNEKTALLLNPKGEVQIGEQVVNMKDINSYQQLVELKRSLPSKSTKNLAPNNYYFWERQFNGYWIWIEIAGTKSCAHAQSQIEYRINYRKLVPGQGWMPHQARTVIFSFAKFADSRGNENVEMQANTLVNTGFHTHRFFWHESYLAMAQREHKTCSVYMNCFALYYSGFVEPDYLGDPKNPDRSTWEQIPPVFYPVQSLCK